MKNTVNIG
ncbi:hypothetical protein TIFTF001_054825 [Ficus carica]|uniref:Uncharacterized protein n=1 Tax=Ficus carica TaxID=3494 RepID=A0AA88EKM3_FICCA|nr:hypothetical protein TIFTF001_054825 [Ficus carica]